MFETQDSTITGSHTGGIIPTNTD